MTNRLLDEVLAKAHQVRTLQERELSASSITPGRGSAAVDSLLTSLAKERDEAKSDFSSANDNLHRLRLELSTVSHQLTTSTTQVEQLKTNMRNKDVKLDAATRGLRIKEREEVIRHAEVVTQRNEAEKLREEVYLLKRTTRELMDELEVSKGKVHELAQVKENYEDQRKDLLARVDLHATESTSLRDSLALITKDCQVQRALAEQRTKEMKHITVEIQNAQALFLKEQQERIHTEGVLKELIEEAQELRNSREQERHSTTTKEAVNNSQLQDMTNRVTQATQRTSQLEEALHQEASNKEDVEKAYATLFTLRQEEEATRKANAAEIEMAQEESSRLRSSLLEMEALKIEMVEVRNDKMDVAALLEESQAHLIQKNNEWDATLQAEEVRWQDRLNSTKQEIIRLEEEVAHLKEQRTKERGYKEVIEDKARDQRAALLNIQEENRRLGTRLRGSDSIIEALKNKVKEMQNIGRTAVRTAKEEAMKHERCQQILIEKRNKYETCLEQGGVMEVKLKVLEQKWQQLEQVNAVLATEKRDASRRLREMESALQENDAQHRRTHVQLVIELEEMRKSFGNFLTLSKEQVRDMKRGVGGGRGSGSGYEKGGRRRW
jgi:chromosome segregation ATPase